MINYFNFKKISNKFLLTNDLGRFVFLDQSYFAEFIKEHNVKDEAVRNQLIDGGFLYEMSTDAFLIDRQHNLIDAKNYLYTSTQLHIFVVTTSCNQQCVYCQAQNGKDLPHDFMSIDVARKSVDIALQSPANNLQFEFQGGEPLLNFEIIRYIVTYAEEQKKEKHINYSIVSNLTLITDEIINFIEKYHINISTSLDGPDILHNYNRPFKNGDSSYEYVVKQIKRLQNREICVGAIQTTTKESLKYPKEIVDAYVKLGFESISLRALTPLGCANKHWKQIGYSPDEFLEFYRKSLLYIIEINKNNTYISEGLARIFLSKILNGYAMNYMELRSPCGAAIGQIAYYYDGSVYTCDEGRMIAEMGNRSFLLGTVNDSYDVLMDSKVCKAVCSASILEGLSSCSECAYQPYCGVCPAVNYALNGDLYEKSPRNYRCKIYGGMLDLLFNLIQDNDTDIMEILRHWIL